MELIRKPTIREQRLLKLLVMESFIELSDNWENKLLVRPMNDGDMGSLYLFPNEEVVENRVFGKQVSEFKFKDLDSVDVIVSLNIDSKGDLFELDVWKADFSKLIEFPDIQIDP